MPKTIEEIKLGKTEMEASLVSIFKKFEEETGVVIGDVHIQRVFTVSGDDGGTIVDVKLSMGF